MGFDEAFWAALDALTEDSRVVIDRPRGSAHPRYPDFIYPLDYGYLENTRSMDGAGIDVWRGTAIPARVEGILCTLDGCKRDSEIKILLGCTAEEIQTVYQAQNEGGMHALLILRPTTSSKG